MEARRGKLRRFLRLIHLSRETEESNCTRCRRLAEIHLKLSGICRETLSDCRRDRQRKEAAALLLSPVARDALELYHAAGTQWHEGFNGRTGMIYSEARTVAEAYGIEWDRPLLDRLRVLEYEALMIAAEEREKAAKEAKAKEPVRGRQ